MSDNARSTLPRGLALESMELRWSWSAGAVRSAAALLMAVALTACSASSPLEKQVSADALSTPSSAPTGSSTDSPPEAGPPGSAPSTTPAPRPSARPEPLASDGRPRASRLSIPALDIDDLLVRPYRGSPDDARGTRIQDRGIAASPYGSGGGTGPGGIGNHIITAHRTSSTRAFADLPALAKGDLVHLDVRNQRFTYRIVATRRTSFRSTRSLAKQSAPVPRKPGVRPRRAMITLSTCRTPEDRAEGNFWSDEFGNPEHRIDKIGVLVRIRSR